jgi:hypothetical protein
LKYILKRKTMGKSLLVAIHSRGVGPTSWAMQLGRPVGLHGLVLGSQCGYLELVNELEGHE